MTRRSRSKQEQEQEQEQEHEQEQEQEQEKEDDANKDANDGDDDSRVGASCGSLIGVSQSSSRNNGNKSSQHSASTRFNRKNSYTRTRTTYFAINAAIIAISNHNNTKYKETTIFICIHRISNPKW